MQDNLISVERFNGLEIRSFPSISGLSKYQENFYAPLMKAGVAVTDWSWSDLSKSNQILHIHWPEAWRWGKAKHLWIFRLFYLMTIPLRKAFLSLIVVNTVHNLRPHEQRSGWSMLIYRWILRQCDAFVHLSQAGRELFLKAYPELQDRIHSVIPHPSFERQLSGIDRAQAREILGIESTGRLYVYVGLIRPYKGVERLIESFKRYAKDGDQLLISGSGDQKCCEKIAETCRGAKNLHFTHRFISEDEMEARVKAADWVVLPFHGGLNSGTAIYAISCGTGIFAPDTPVFRETKKLVGEDSCQLFREGEFEEAFRVLLASPPPPPPDVSAFSEQQIGRLAGAFFNSLRKLVVKQV